MIDDVFSYTLVIPDCELFDNETQEFTVRKGATIKLMHSLKAIALWEAAYERPFLSEEKGPRNNAEIRDYIRYMTIEPEYVDPGVYENISNEQIMLVLKYLDRRCSSTWVGSSTSNKSGKRTAQTNEVIYWEMFAMGIPIECENWNFNHLMQLIKVCAAKNNPKKESKSSALARARKTNAARRRKK